MKKALQAIALTAVLRQTFVLYILDFAIISLPFLILRAIFSLIRLTFSTLFNLVNSGLSLAPEEIDRFKMVVNYNELRLFVGVFLSVFLIFYIFFIPIIRYAQYKKMVKAPMKLGKFYLTSLLLPLLVVGIVYGFGRLFDALPTTILAFYLSTFVFNLLNEKRFGFKKKIFEKKNLVKIGSFSLLHLFILYLALNMYGRSFYLFVFFAPLLFLLLRIFFLKYVCNLLSIRE